MKITHADVILTSVPARRPHKMAIGTTTVQECVYLKLYTDEGVVGLGEVPHMVGHSAFGETQASVALQLKERLLPTILGRDPFQIEALQQLIDRTLPANPRAKAGINMALHDIKGKALNKPVYDLLGGLFRDRIPLSWSIGIMPIEEGVREAQLMVDQGFSILKVKTGARVSGSEDVAFVGAIRKAVGNQIHVRADANQGYDVPTAIRVIRQMQEVELESMEQPVHRDDLQGMAEVRQAVQTYIMADESANSPRDVYEIALSRAADLISIYIVNGAGITGAMKMAAVAEAAGLRSYIGGALEGPIAARACLHFGAAAPNVSYGCEMTGQFLLEEDLSDEPIAFLDGCLVVPNRPGLGGDLDAKKLARYETARFTVHGDA